MSKRFIIEKENITKVQNSIRVIGEEVHHINVLRYKIGDNVYLNEYEVKITELNKDILIGEIIGLLPQKGIPGINITLVQGYLKSDKMDYVVQKAVELGVKEIIPALTKNTVVKLNDLDKVKKQQRLNKIAKEAVQQCGRADEVEVLEVSKLENINWDIYDAIFVCHETSNTNFKEILRSKESLKNIAVVVGPEGGLDEQEVMNMMKNKNATDISLGERILRAETASLMVLSILSYELS